MEKKQERHDVVEMLLNRIKDYPEDFFAVEGGYVYNKWCEALNTAKQVMTEEEKLVIESELQAAKRAVYMGAALKTMLSDEKPEEKVNRYATSLGTSMQNTASTLNNALSNSITIGRADLTEEKINLITEIQAKQKAMEAQMQRDTAMNRFKSTLYDQD